jgi:branched-subunit amino acid transport protein
MLALGALSWVLRVAFVLVLPAQRLPGPVVRGLEHLAPAVLASICAVELCSVTRGGSMGACSAAVGLIAGAGLVAYWTRNLTVTVSCGLLGVLLLDLVLL